MVCDNGWNECMNNKKWVGEDMSGAGIYMVNMGVAGWCTDDQVDLDQNKRLMGASDNYYALQCVDKLSNKWNEKERK